jgi:hypothetical protein
MQSADSAKLWLAFLRNRREAIAATDFFTVPTITFGVLHCFFVISHNRRRILHFNVTNDPTSLWIVQQLRDAFSIRVSAQVSDFRPGCEIRVGGFGGRSIPADKPCPHALRESLAKRCGGALGRKLPTRPTIPFTVTLRGANTLPDSSSVFACVQGSRRIGLD